MKQKSSSRSWILACVQFYKSRGDSRLGCPRSAAPQIWIWPCTHKLYWKTHALYLSIPLERHSRTPPHPVAQPLSPLANRNLLWREDAADRISRILGVRHPGTQQPMAISQVDSRDGTLRPPPAKKFVVSNCLLSVPGSRRAFQ